MTALLDRARDIIHTLSRPKRGDLKSCGWCGASNEPWRSSCVTCARAI